MTIFLGKAPCRLVKVDRCFRCAYCLHHQDDHHFTIQLLIAKVIHPPLYVGFLQQGMHHIS
jgi:hypothetical protein